MKTYKDQPSWEKIQNYLPGHNRITKDFYPVEKSLYWNKMKIHIDFYPASQSKVKIILLHGVGGNGRLLSFIGIPLFKNGYEVICPDLPGYGLTELNNNMPSYETWVNLVKFRQCPPKIDYFNVKL
jgi:pimeloyl-ACP methyl ester carboxylesterase